MSARAQDDLLAGLSVAIAAIMEDEVVRAVLLLPVDDGMCAERFEALRLAGDDIGKLAAAAKVILRRSIG